MSAGALPLVNYEYYKRHAKYLYRLLEIRKHEGYCYPSGTYAHIVVTFTRMATILY